MANVSSRPGFRQMPKWLGYCIDLNTATRPVNLFVLSSQTLSLSTLLKAQFQGKYPLLCWAATITMVLFAVIFSIASSDSPFDSRSP